MSTETSPPLPTQRITVGYLATTTGADGVELGVTLARATGAALDLVCVVREEEPDGNPGRGGYQELLISRAEEWLRSGAERVPDDVEVATHVPIAESFAEGLIDFATTHDARVIVVGGTSDGLLGRHTLGSISSELVHCSPVPVALAPRGYTDPRPGLTTVTVAVPTTARSDNPLSFALGLAGHGGASLRLVSLVSLDDHPTDHDSAKEVRARHVSAARTNLERATDALSAEVESPEIESVVADGDTLEEAMASLRWGPGDLLALGSGRLGAERRVFLGSTAARILKVTTAPIVVVPKS
ncbi:universal stress protein [Williamsia sterculiae]|uniref:Nucleotide-binding universal stress protein, UspA family n=1 Tax=Williamsia sterculiae TaxID=1344003 RepID=A0A1N7DWV3_9NOCA|nr:universal stress protein [Williamsia sterculiae]SIR80303.1 Nucleotide-binding universal stress protein, UspA family [Williamsia sterculiae]